MYGHVVDADLIDHTGVDDETDYTLIGLGHQSPLERARSTGIGKLAGYPWIGIDQLVYRCQHAFVATLGRPQRDGRGTACHADRHIRRNSRHACFFCRGSASILAVPAIATTCRQLSNSLETRA